MKKHANIPIFIPHLGCPNNCVFCNQRKISGKTEFHPETVIDEIERALATVGDRETEIAFFGGSFTGIDRGLMIYLLDTAQKFVDEGRVKSIRLSTRPDYIDDEILGILSRYAVETVELGIQSVSAKVLAESRRGHTAQASYAAMKAVKDAGFLLVGQMMIGLPGADGESELETAAAICAANADGARVYPTVVFRDTELCAMAQNGEYTPLTDEDAIVRTADVLDVFDRAGVPVIRVGLCATENLASDEAVYAGANHPAIGERAMSELYYRRICETIEKSGFHGENLTIFAPLGAAGKIAGQKRRNIGLLREKYGVNRIKILEKNGVIGYNVDIE